MSNGFRYSLISRPLAVLRLLGIATSWRDAASTHFLNEVDLRRQAEATQRRGRKSAVKRGQVARRETQRLPIIPFPRRRFATEKGSSDRKSVTRGAKA